MYRTNISTITDFNILLKQLPVYYAGDKRHTFNLSWPHGFDLTGTMHGLIFVEGSNIVLHKKAVLFLNQYTHDLDSLYVDDLVIAHYLKTHPTLLEPFVYRHKTDDNRWHDVDQMKQSVLYCKNS
jgi:hypothetical protein